LSTEIYNENLKASVLEVPKNPNEDNVFPNAELFNPKTQATHMFDEIHMSFKNYHAIEQALLAGRAKDLGAYPKVKNKPVIIVCSGRSANDAIPKLSQWKGDIICSTSQASTCVYYGKDPKYIMALDPDSSWNEIRVDTWEGRDSILVFHPGIHWDLVSSWPNKMALFRKLQPQTPFYGNAQNIGYSVIKRIFTEEHMLKQLQMQPFIPTEIVMLGCVLNSQIFLAETLGYNPIYLVGADLSYVDYYWRYDSWSYDGLCWIEAKSGVYDKDEQKLMGSRRGIPTDLMMLFYRKNFASACRLSKCQIISCSAGLLEDDGREPPTHLPHAEFDDVLEQQGKMGGKIVGVNRKEAYLRAEGYMAQKHTFVIKFARGIQFTEFEGGAFQVLEYMWKILEHGVKDLDYNGTIRGIKKLARAGYLTNEETKAVLNWEYKPEYKMEKTSEDGLRMPELRVRRSPGSIHKIAPVNSGVR
jgi:hypothetical protein